MDNGLAEVKERSVPPPSSPFISGPPAPSDAVGVAKAVVFAPRLEATTSGGGTWSRSACAAWSRAGSAPSARSSWAQDGFVDLPIDQNGALYVADWSTGDGQTFALILRDGATGQEAASAKVKPEQSEGLFFFVGYRLK